MNALVGLERWFSWLLQTSWQAAVLAGLILLAQFLLRKRLSLAWRHVHWFLLLARLLMPMTPSSPVSIFNLAKASRPQARPVSAAPATPAQAGLSPANAPSWPEVVLPASPLPVPPVKRELLPRLSPTVPAAVAAPVAVLSRADKALDWLAIAAVAWLAGAVALTLRFVWLTRRFSRRLAGCLPVQKESFKKLVGNCAQSLGVKQRIVVLETAEADSPAVYGLWRKRLLLPGGLLEVLTPEELRHVLLHELAHLKRRDSELNGLATTLQILHWFNPVLWLAFARMRADRELATDELALAHACAGERGAYGETILKVLEGLGARAPLHGLVGIGESKAQIGERIRAIARGATGPRWRWAACLLATVLAGITLTSAREEQSLGTDLLKKYPTTLTVGDAAPNRARPWQFTETDIFQVSRFRLEVGKDLRVETQTADLGIGHCADGAVWAVLIPREGGKLTSPVATNAENVAHVWLRFHPAKINQIFPPESVSTAGRGNLEEQIRAVAEAKFTSSWHAGQSAMVPEPKDMTVDIDTKGGPRRFFMVDTEAKTAEYVNAFADRTVKAAKAPAYVPEVDTNCASVVSVTPPNGAQDVALTQELRVRFDRPMNPYHLKLEWLAGGFQPNGSVQVTADQKEFVIPVRLTPGQDQTLALNHDPQREMWAQTGRKGKRESSPFARAGFQDAAGVTANEFRWSFSTKESPITPNAPKPRVVSVSPPSGSTTPVLTFVEIAFDQPMRPPEQTFPYQDKRPFIEGPSLIPSFDYDSKANKFTFPVLLRSEDDVRLTLKGFYSAAGVACDPVVLHYQTTTEPLDPKYVAQAKAGAQDPKLQKLLTSMKAARTRFTSGIETVQTIHLAMTKNTFNGIEAQTATFKWEGTNKAYADISGPMMTAGVFILGSDGANCWLYSENEKGEKRLDQTPVSVTDQHVSLADPFALSHRSVAEVLAEEGLVLASSASLEGRPCYRVEKWEVSQEPMVSASQNQWWIDEETSLPKQFVSYSGNWCQVVRFDYQDLNQHLPENAFQPPAAPGGDAHPLFFDKQPAPGEHRFLRISDGSDGRMSGRLGWHGSSGTTSSGLN